jgi:hypothetical protein
MRSNGRVLVAEGGVVVLWLDPLTPWRRGGANPGRFDDVLAPLDHYWDFSVRAVPGFQNSIAGRRLGAYLTDDRVLQWDPTLPLETNDRFYVRIT